MSVILVVFLCKLMRKPENKCVLRDLQFYSMVKSVSWSVILITQVSEDEIVVGFDFSDYRSLIFRE